MIRDRSTIGAWKGGGTLLTLPVDYRAEVLNMALRMHEEGRRFAYQKGCALFGGNVYLWWGRVPKAKRPACGAKTRKGTPCQARCVDGKAKCRLHGGLSTGPTSAAGRERIAESNRRRAQARRAAT
jgi:hypothetical protein